MSKRLGKRERALRKDQWQLFRALRSEVVNGNLATPKAEFATSKGYAKVIPERTMTHGLYRGLYDPMLSTDKDTKRGMRLPRALEIKGVKLHAK